MDRDTDIREQNGGCSREAAAREIEEIRKLEKQLADMKTRFTAGTLTSEVYLKKKKTIEKRITGLREKVKAAAAKQKEKGKPLNNNKKIYTIIIIAVIVTGAAVWGLLSLAGGPSTGYDAGMRAPGFSFQTTGNSQATLNDYKGRQVVLTVWDGMESCTEEASSLKKATDSLSPDKTAALLVIGGTDAELAADCIKKQNIAIPVLPDPRRDITRLYGVNNISKTIFIDEKADIVHVRFGSLSGREDIDAAFNAAQINETGRSGAVSNVNITSLTHDSAVISWTDSVPGTATVAVTDGRQQKIINDQTVSSSHMITVDKLGAGTTYTITITVKDSSGKEYFARGYSLRTLADKVPPVIKDAKTSKIESDSVTVTWDTDEPANGQVEFGETAVLGGKTTPDSILTTSHSVSVTGLKPSTTYYLRITAKDAHGNESMLDLATITTKQALTGGIAVGMRAPDFILKGIDGKTVQLSTLKGHPVMLQFFHTECRACVTEMPMIKKVYNEWRDRGLLLYTITRESHIANLQTFANIHQLTFPMLMDPDEQVTDQYQIPFTPYFIFIDREGIVREINEGRFNSESVLIEALNKLF